MPTPISSALSVIELSTDNATWKALICLSGWTAQVQTQKTTNDTQCGRIVGLGVITFAPTVTAICDRAPSNVQISYGDCLNFQTAKTKLFFRLASPAEGSYSLGQSFYLSGECYITDTTLTDDTAGAQPLKFSVTIDGQGELTTVAP